MNTSTAITHQLAIYDPRHLSEADFLNSFVGRHEKLAYLLRQIKAVAGENKHHLLLFGSRGMGKTSMLRRIAIAIRENETLNHQWLPVSFREEQYNVRQLRFLWLNACDSVAEWCEQTGDQDNAMRLDQAQDSNADTDTLWALLREISQQHGRRLLLLLDNLDLILESLPEQDQWALRRILSHPDGPMMVATTSQFIKALTQGTAPFYDFFQLHDLKPLEADELRACLLRIAATRGVVGQRVTQEIDRQPARLRVLHVLTNGNPRTLFHIYQILESLNPANEGAPQSLMSVLESLLDSVTPLYKARTEELTPQQRQILDAIALAWDPKSSAWIAAQTGLAATTLSPQLKRLRALGIIEETSLANNKTGLQLRERFYNIWYLLRHGPRRGRQRLSFVTRFLEAWYSPEEREGMARSYLRAGADKHHPDYSLALASAMTHKGLQRALVQDATHTLFQRNELLDDIIGRELDPVMMDRQQQQESVRQSLQEKGWAGEDIQRFWELLASSPSLLEQEKLRIIQSIDSLEQDQLTQLLIKWESEISRLEEVLSAELTISLRQALQQGRIRDGEDIEGCRAVAETEGNKTILLYPLFFSPELFARETSSTEITSLVQALFTDSISALNSKTGFFNLGNLLLVHFSRYDEAEQAYRKTIELDPKYAWPWINLGNLLRIHFSRYDEAEQAYRKAIELDPNDAWPWNNLGNLLQGHFSRYDEAEQAYRKAIELDPNDAWPWNDLGNLLQDHFSRYDEAEQVYRKAIELDPNTLFPKGNLCWLAIKQGRLVGAKQLRQELDTFPATGRDLMDAALALNQDNFGDAWVLLRQALDRESPYLWNTFRCDLLRLVRLFQVRQYGHRLLETMKETGYSLSLAPFYHAVEAYVFGAERLNNINPETRIAAQTMFHWLTSTPDSD